MRLQNWLSLNPFQGRYVFCICNSLWLTSSKFLLPHTLGKPFFFLNHCTASTSHHLQSPQMRLGRSSKNHLFCGCEHGMVREQLRESVCFSSSNTCIIGIELGLSGLVVNTATHWALSSAQEVLSFIEPRSSYVVQHGLDFQILLPQPLQCRIIGLCHCTGWVLL